MQTASLWMGRLPRLALPQEVRPTDRGHYQEDRQVIAMKDQKYMYEGTKDLTIRLPVSLYRLMEEAAIAARISKAEFIRNALEAKVGEHDAVSPNSPGKNPTGGA